MNFNKVVLEFDGRKVKVTTDQVITEAWKTEMIAWIKDNETKLRG